LNALESLRVSVVIPTHARRDRLLRLLASLERQTLPPAQFEVRVMHNHTDDGTEAGALDWCARQPFAATYVRCGFRGPAGSRDRGAREATAPVLAFIDDDCVAAPHWLERGLAHFDAAAARGTPIGLLQGRTRPLTERPPRFPYRAITIEGFSPWFETCNIFYERAAYLAVGGFSPEYLHTWGGEDTDLGWKLRESGRPTLFADDVVVQHEVFTISFWQWLTEPLRYAKLPALVRKHPGLRDCLYRRWFLSVDTFLFHGLVLALLLWPASRGASMALLAAYGVARWRTGAHLGGSPLARVARIVMGVPRGAFAWWGLVSGSLRARCWLL
jgi:GT2 family glycosyltransferase